MKKNKVPPLLLLLFFAAVMSISPHATRNKAPRQPGAKVHKRFRLLGGILFSLSGAFLCWRGVHVFRQAQTTVNPIRPEQASELVTTDIYKYSRNPMYLGFTSLLIAWGILLARPMALPWIPAFVLYLNFFQIQPEEEVLQKHFGTRYKNYCQNVRRWI